MSSSKVTNRSDETATKRHVALYARVSTQEQATEGISLEAQESKLRRYAAEHWPNVTPRLYRDAGKSARAGKERPAYAQMVAAIETGEVVAVVATKDDRLARSTHVSLHLRVLCVETDTELHTLATGKLETSAAGQLTSGVLAEIAQFESNLRSERTTEALSHLASQGYWPSGKPPWGYERGADRILRPSADAHLIRQAFERYAEGATLRAVQRFLEGAPKQEREIVPLYHVSRLLRRATYAGWIVTDTTSGAPQRHEGKHEAIVPRDLFERVQNRLADNKETGYRGQNLSPLGPTARCGACDASLRIKRLPPADGGYAYFRCSADCGRVKQIPVEHLEAAVVAYLSVAPLWVETALESGEWRGLLGESAAREKLEAELATWESGRDTTRYLARSGALPPDEAAADLRESERQIRNLRASLEPLTLEADELRADLERLRDEIDHGFTGGRNLAQFWQSATTEEKRAAVASFVERIYLYPSGISLLFRYGLRPPTQRAYIEQACDSANAPAHLREALLGAPPQPFEMAIPLPITRERRKPEHEGVHAALGFGIATSADRAKSTPHGDGRESGSVRRSAARSTSSRKSRSGWRAQSEGRTPIPPSAAPPARD